MPTDLFSLLSPKNLVLFVVILVRLGGMLTTAPLINGFSIPMQIKIWFMALVAFIIFPMVLAKSGFQLPNSIPALTLILIKEFVIGYIIGFTANLVFIGTEVASDLVSMQIGLTSAQAMNPVTGDTSPVLGQSYTVLAGLIFIGLSGYNWIITAVYKSFQILPPSYDIRLGGTITHNIIYLTSQIFEIGLGIALPIFSVLLITDVLLGFVSKMMPQMNIFMVSLPVKISLGLILLVMLTPNLATQLQILFEKYLSSIIPVLGG